MEWAGRKERFGNTPENKIRPDLSKLNPGGFRFQAMVLKHHLTASPSFPKRGLHLSLVCFASKFGVALPRSENAGDPGAAAAIKFDKQPAKVWAGPLRGLQIAKQSEKARRHQSGACSDLTAPGFFVAQTALCRYKSNWRKQKAPTNQVTSPVKSFLHSFFLPEKSAYPSPEKRVSLPRKSAYPSAPHGCRRIPSRFQRTTGT